MPKNVKFCEARITNSNAYPGAVSLRPRNCEDIRGALADAGFTPGDKVVIMSEAMYFQMLDQATRLPNQPKIL